MGLLKFINLSKKVSCVFFVSVCTGLMLIFLPEDYKQFPLIVPLLTVLGSMLSYAYSYFSTKSAKKRMEIKIKKIELATHNKLQIELEMAKNKFLKEELEARRVEEERLSGEVKRLYKQKNEASIKLATELKLHDELQEELRILREKTGIGNIKDSPLDEMAEKKIIDKVKKEQEDALKEMTITQLFLGEQKNKIHLALSISVFTTVLSLAASYIIIDNSSYAFLFPALFSVLLIVKDKVLSFRIDKGYFGANKFEATQLLEYIEKNKDKIDFNGPGGGSRKIFKDLAIEPERNRVVKGKEIYS